VVNIETKLSGDLVAAMDAYEAKITNSVIMSGVAAMARVIYDEVKLNTSGQRAHGKPLDPPGVKTGTLDASIYRVYSPERSGDGFKTYRVSVNKSKAPHWYLIEFGWSRASAHPYLRPAFDHIEAAIKAGQARMATRLMESDWNRLASGEN